MNRVEHRNVFGVDFIVDIVCPDWVGLIMIDGLSSTKSATFRR